MTYLKQNPSRWRANQILLLYIQTNAHVLVALTGRQEKCWERLRKDIKVRLKRQIYVHK